MTIMKKNEDEDINIENVNNEEVENFNWIKWIWKR